MTHRFRLHLPVPTPDRLLEPTRAKCGCVEIWTLRDWSGSLEWRQIVFKCPKHRRASLRRKEKRL